MKKRIFVAVALLIIVSVFVWSYDRKNTISLSKELDIATKNIPTRLSFNVKGANIYVVKIDFSKTDDKNKNRLFSMPLTFSMKLIKDGSQILIDEVYTINGVSGQNRDRSAFREISTLLFDPGSYVIEIVSINDEPALNEYKPKLTVSRIKQ